MVRGHRHIGTQTHTHTLGAADAAAEVVTSLLGGRVTNEPEHIVLALEMSRGVKMSPQIAPGQQMSPLHSAPHLSLPPTLLPFPLFLICLSFSFCFALLSIYSPLLPPSSLSSSTADSCSCFDTTFLFISSKGQRGEENRVKESYFLTPLLSALTSFLSFSYISLHSFHFSSSPISPYIYFPSIHQLIWVMVTGATRGSPSN